MIAENGKVDGVFSLPIYFGARQNSAFIDRREWDVSFRQEQAERARDFEQNSIKYGGMAGAMEVFINLMERQAA